MLKIVSARRFIRPMSTGKSRPMLMECAYSDGQTVEVVVKLSGACERKIGALVMEAMMAMLAKDLGLPVPEPLAVHLPEPSLAMLGELAPYQDAAAKSAAVSFGSTLLASHFKPWTHRASITPDLIDMATRILAFDAWMENPDRRPSNPNCKFNGARFAIFDHELCCTPSLFMPRPWEPNGLEFWRGDDNVHLFRRGLRGCFFFPPDLETQFLSIRTARIDAYIHALPPAWHAGRAIALQTRSHIMELQSHITAAITELNRVMS